MVLHISNIVNEILFNNVDNNKRMEITAYISLTDFSGLKQVKYKLLLFCVFLRNINHYICYVNMGKNNWVVFDDSKPAEYIQYGNVN